jgi:hypothetical protein
MLEAAIHSTERSDGHSGADDARPPQPEPRRRDLLARLSAMSLAGFGRRLDVDRHAVTEATAVARAWLQLVDAGRPAVSRASAAPALRETIGAREWERALGAVRGPLGSLRSRTLRGRATVEAFPGVPPGPYVVLHFASAFERRPGVIETVTTCLGDDGRWRVAAYFMR